LPSPIYVHTEKASYIVKQADVHSENVISYSPEFESWGSRTVH